MSCVVVVVVVGIVTTETNLEMVTEPGAGDIAPFDQHDPVELCQFGQRQLVDVVRRIEAIDVGMVEGQLRAAGIAVDQRERGRGDRFGHAQGASEALGECGLAGPHLARQDDDVADPRQSGQRSSDGMGIGK